jgi:hypothetical protein
MIGILATTLSCSKQRETTPTIMKKITELEEFKKEQRRIDSLKQDGRNVEITVSIIQGSLDEQDKGKDISTAFINEDIGVAETILYKVKFNSKTEEIISIEAN